MLPRTLAFSALALALFAGAAPVALAQKADPPAFEYPPEESPDIAKLRYAYEKAGFPRVMVLVGRGTDEHQVIDPGSILSNTDSTAVTFKIKAAFEQVINDPRADLELVSINDLRSTFDRLKTTLINSHDDEAATLIGKQVQAELLILIRLTKSDAQGSPFSVIFETSNPVRGRKGQTFAFDWKGDTSQPEINANAAAMARKFINDFAERVNQPSKYTLRFLGLDTPDSLRIALDAVRSIEGIKRVRTRATSIMDDPFTGKKGSAAEYEATIDPAAETDQVILLAAIAESMKQKLAGSEVLLRQTESGTIVIKVVPRGSAAVTASGTPAAAGPVAATADCAAKFIAEGADGNAKRTELRSAYEAKGSPRVAVFVNRSLAAANAPASTGLAPDGLIVINSAVATAPGTTTGPAADRAEFLPRQIERTLSDRLGPAFVGLRNVVSAQVARSQLLDGKNQSEIAVPQSELIAALQKSAIADVIIIGAGTGTPDGTSIKATFRFQAIRMSDGAQLAVADASALLSGDADTGAMARLSDEALGKLCCSLLASWR